MMESEAKITLFFAIKHFLKEINPILFWAFHLILIILPATNPLHPDIILIVSLDEQ
jgi:hypothetical protein